MSQGGTPAQDATTAPAGFVPPRTGAPPDNPGRDVTASRAGRGKAVPRSGGKTSQGARQGERTGGRTQQGTQGDRTVKPSNPATRPAGAAEPSGDSAAAPAARTITISGGGSGVQLGGASGAFLALFAYPLAFNLIKGGPAQMWQWVRAKFINAAGPPAGPPPATARGGRQPGPPQRGYQGPGPHLHGGP